jgi:hypothetical protein
LILQHIRSLLLLLCLTFSLVLSGCVGGSSHAPSIYFQVTKDDPPFVAHFKNSIGTLWYDVRFSGVRIGRARTERSIEMQDGEPVYHFSLDEQSRLQILGTSNNISRQEEKCFSSTYPYSLLFSSYRVAYGDVQALLEVDRIGPGKYKVTGTLGRDGSGQIVKGRFYGLEDELDLEMWLLATPEIGESESFQVLRSDILGTGNMEASIKEISNELVDGQKRNIYEILTRAQEGGFGHLKYNEDGEMIFKSGPERVEYHLQRFKPPLPTSDSADIYVNSIVPVEQKIGRADTIGSLEIIINGPHINLLETSPGQWVECNDTNGACKVKIGDIEAVPPVRATEVDVTEYLQATPRILSDSSLIVKMANDIVGETTDREKQIEKLVQYIDSFLMGGYVFHTNLIDLLKERKGDCTEYALLFVALARSLGIPCREVSGLVYMGDWCQGFGLHAWNEVFINGRWRGVDSSSNSSRIHPVYIRFPDDPYKNILLVEAAREMKIEIEKVTLHNEL